MMMQSGVENSGPIVVGVSGSIRNGSFTRRVVEIALRGAQDVGARTQLIDLREYNLIFCDGKEDEREYPEDVYRLRRELSQAAGIILGTPEYHGSFSGVLKNALDLMGFREFQGKMIGLVGVSSGASSAGQALHQLRIVGRALHAWVVPEQAQIAEPWAAFDETGALKDMNLEMRLKNVGRQVAHFAALHTTEEARNY
jgi:FMN reductase